VSSADVTGEFPMEKLAEEQRAAGDSVGRRHGA
jgi:hypothetical protein